MVRIWMAVNTSLLWRSLSSTVSVWRSISIQPDTWFILPYYSNRNHIFLSDFWRGEINIVEQSKLLNKQEGQSGSVNLHRAKLSGIFSEYTNPLYMNFGELMRHSNLDAAEITAVMLHEIGHGFNACYYADRTDRVNQVMRSIQQLPIARAMAILNTFTKNSVKSALLLKRKRLISSWMV